MFNKSVQTYISDQRNGFQSLVLGVLCVELVPELRGKRMDKNFITLLSDSISLLNQNLGWLTSVSTKQEFCWGVLVTCCSKIIISNDNFNWVDDYSTIIKGVDLGLIFRACEEKTKVPDEINLHRYVCSYGAVCVCGNCINILAKFFVPPMP